MGLSHRAVVGVLAVLLMAFPVLAASQAPEIDWSLDEALNQIDRQARDFRSAMARIEVVRHDDAGSELSRYTGNGFFNERGFIRLSLDGDRYVVLLESNNVQVYDASQSSVVQYAINKHRERLEPWLRNGFSTAGEDLKNRFIVTSLGEEAVGPHRTIVLELTPKRERDREAIRHMRLWIDQASWMPVRQEVSRTSSSEKLTVHYTQMARNLPLNRALFEDSWPRGTKKTNAD
jgi:outer membrane lipoprotein-sorting protein